MRRARRINVGDGHLLYVEEVGVPDGTPVLFLHGGPGSGCSATQRQLFDGLRYRVIFVDQRGAGSSLPQGGLAANTTPDLVADLEVVREALGIRQWLLFGGSWGSLLGLAYAQLYPERTLGLVLRGIFLGSQSEIEHYVSGFQNWLLVHAPEIGLRMASTASHALPQLAGWVLGHEQNLALAVTRAWLNYERSLLGEAPLSAEPDARQQAKVAIQMHYLGHHCFLGQGQLLAGVRGIRHLPAVIVQGLDDPVCPPVHAEQLHRVWPEATWMPIPGGGHGALEPAIARACLKGLDWVAEAALTT